MSKSIVHQRYLESINEKRDALFSKESISLLNRKDNSLHPLEQMDILNRQAEKFIDFPLVVVGGQAVAYWIWVYQEAFDKNIFNNKKLFSYDIDYVAPKEKLQELSFIWDIDLQLNDFGQPPSIGIMFASKNNKIKEHEGLLFYNEEIDMPNLIDFIFAPAGFEYQDMKSLPSKYFSSYFNSNSFNNNIKILSPLGCIRSRLANIYQNIKRSTIFLEIERLHSLNVTFIAHQIKNINEGQINLFYKTFADYRNEIMNANVSKIDAKYKLNLIQPFEYFLENSNLIEGKVKKDFIDGFLHHSHKNYLKLYNHKLEVLNR